MVNLYEDHLNEQVTDSLGKEDDPVSENSSKEVSFKAETLPHNQVLVRTELSTFVDNAEVPVEIWEPLLGGDVLRQELWDKLLVDEGDSVIVKGSTVVKLMFGGYIYDKSTGLATKGLRSDIDLDIYTPTVLARAQAISTTKRNVAESTFVDGLRIDFANQEKIRSMLVEATETIISQLGRDTRSVESSETQENLEAVKATHLLPSLMQLNELLTTNTNEATLFALNAFSKHEQMGIRMERINGELRATVVDPIGTLEQQDLYIGQLAIQGHEQEERGVYDGHFFRSQATLAVYPAIMEAALYMKTIECTSEAVPYYTATSISRMMRAACEHSVDVYGDPTNPEHPQPYYSYYMDIVNLANRLAERKEKLFVASPDSPDLNIDNLYEKIELKFQQDFAKSAFAKPDLAVAYMFAHLPLGNYISEDVADMFDDYRKHFPCNNTMLDIIKMYDINEQRLAPEHDIPAMHFLTRLRTITENYYGHNALAMEKIDMKDDDKSVYFLDFERTPSGMSEVMALIAVCANWDQESNKDEIQRMVDKWKPQGEVALPWHRSEDITFDTGVSMEEVLEKMQELQNYTTPKSRQA